MVKKPVEIKEITLYGLSDKKNRIIEIDPKLRGKEELDTLIHEALHIAFPRMGEKNVHRGAGEITDILWKSKFRRIKR